MREIIKTGQRYKGEEGRQYHQRRSIPDSAYQWVAKLRAEKISPEVKETDVILEYGVGSGWNLAELRCRRRIGFDLSEHLRTIVENHGIEFIKNTSAIKQGSINVVLCHHILEHTSNPVEILNKIRRMLSEGGKLLLFREKFRNLVMTDLLLFGQ
jgi:2-polyprenyl-3-methyl-5-hydroxy-6-metoxy-1,4-benzoquinol methylase